MKGKAIWFSLIILAVFLRPAAAEIYQWVDEKGVTHFSGKKPIHLDADSEIKIRKDKYKKNESEDENENDSVLPKGNVEGGVVWHNYTEGLRLSKRTGKGAIVIFYTKWCPTCQKYMKLFDGRTIIMQTRKFVMIRVNQDKYPSLSSKYDLDGKYVPRTFAVGPAGKILHQVYPMKSRSRYYLGTRRTDLISFMRRFVKVL